MAHRRTPLADSDPDDIWYYAATSTGSTDAADRMIDSITDRFISLGKNPFMGRRRDEDLRPGLRSFPVGEYIILYRVEEEDVVILRVIRGSRNLTHIV
jgi:toxin ParE1/3/4